MLYELLHNPIRLFSYLTFRSALVLFTAVIIFFTLGPWFIRKIQNFEILHEIRDEGPQEHKVKAGTPTMGGILIAVATLVPTLLWADLSNAFVQVALMACVFFAAVGGSDDLSRSCANRTRALRRGRNFFSRSLWP